MVAGLTVVEYGPPDRWYRSFSFSCGEKSSECSRAELDRWLDSQRTGPRGDPCATVRPRGIKAAGSLADKVAQHYQDLTLRFSLRVSRRLPEHPPGDEACKGER
jgi:hypothetical protein